MRLQCLECKTAFEAKNFNLLRITISCPVCATESHISSAITRLYGKVVGEQVSKIMKAVELLGNRTKSDVTIPLGTAYAKIEELCKGVQ